MSTLDQLVSRAREAKVADDDARAYVADLHRWGRLATPAPRPMLWWLAGGFALAAAAAVVVMLMVRRPQTEAAVRIGERVAIIPEAGAVYRVAATDATHTEIDVERGTVTARLFHGETGHKLTLVGGGVSAHAVGTIYSLTVENGQGAVDVAEGTVRVEHGGQTESVPAGTTWPPSAPRRAHASQQLAALAPLALPEKTAPVDAAVDDSDTAEVDAAPVEDARVDDAKAAEPPRISDAGVKSEPADAASEPSVTDRWRRARLLRGQGDFAAAIADCIAIADAKDTTWSPIALLEAARIELGPRASPERAIDLADRLVRDWPSHQLVPEARELRCRALRQLGRDAECAKTP